MFDPTKVFPRRQRRQKPNHPPDALATPEAATGIPNHVIARGHNIQRVPEIPLVISALNTLKKTKEAVKLLKAINAYPDVEKAKTTSKIRPGQGKSRNRRYVNRKGPLLVLNKNEGGWSAFRNLPGVDLCYVSALNLLQLAPGSHLGRFIIWSEAAFRELNNVFGTYQEGAKTRSFRLPRPVVANADVTRIINSDEVRSVLRPRRKNKRRGVVGHNPLRSARAYAKVSPLGKILRKQQESRKRNKLALKALKRSGKFKRAGKKSDAARKAAAKAAWAKGGKKVKVIRQTGFSKNAAAKKASKKGTKKAAGRAPPPKSA
jgi:large subunit ribosomal protein L4e